MDAGDTPPGPPGSAREVYRALHQAIRAGWVRACHDLSEGGLAVAAAEMCIGGRLGLALDLQTDDPIRALFGETNGCLLLEVDPRHAAQVDALLRGLPAQKLGDVTQQPTLSIRCDGQALVDLPVEALVAAWTTEA
jgi:phosphoribosylformylglycinamidine synthase